MKSIYFAAFDGFSLISKMIKFWTRSEYSHIAYLKDEHTLIETWGDGSLLGLFKIYWKFVKENPFKYHKYGTYIEIWKLNVKENEYKYIDNFLTNLAINKIKYDYKGVIGFVLKFKKDNSKRYFCSEGCITPLVYVKNWYKIKPNLVSPADFVRIIQAAGGQLVKKFILEKNKKFELNDKGE